LQLCEFITLGEKGTLVVNSLRSLVVVLDSNLASMKLLGPVRMRPTCDQVFAFAGDEPVIPRCLVLYGLTDLERCTVEAAAQLRVDLTSTVELENFDSGVGVQ
jgi:hypothetical protein